MLYVIGDYCQVVCVYCGATQGGGYVKVVSRVVFFEPSQEWFHKYDKQVWAKGVPLYGTLANFYWGVVLK